MKDNGVQAVQDGKFHRRLLNAIPNAWKGILMAGFTNSSEPRLQKETRQLMEKYYEYGKTLYMAFLDIKKRLILLPELKYGKH